MVSKVSCRGPGLGLALVPDHLLHLLDDGLLGGQTELLGELAVLVVVAETLS